MDEKKLAVFDQVALNRRRQRAVAAPVVFLLQHVATQMAERLSVVLRSFERVAEIGSLSTHFAEALDSSRRALYLRIGPRVSCPDVVGHEAALPLRARSLDLIVSGLALQFVDDLPGAFVQIRRVLKPDGLFMVALAGGGTLAELKQAFAQAEAEIEGGASPRVIPFIDVRGAGALLQRAGFALPVADTETLTARYDNALALMADLRGMGATNVLVQRRRTPARRAVFARMAEIYAERFADPDGRIKATFEIIWLSGWAPHDSQQKPLKPGSAQARLADALRPTDPKS